MLLSQKTTKKESEMDENEEYEELARLAQDREDAEKAGVFDDDRIYDYIDGETTKLTVEQEMTLHYAVSSLSSLMKETNSSLSELLKMGGMDNG